MIDINYYKTVTETQNDSEILKAELLDFIKEVEESIPIVPPVKPACGHKRTAKQFFIEQYQEGKCKDITTNPYPEFNNAFYLNIYN